MRTETTAPTALAAEVEGLLDAQEPEAAFRDTRECAGGLLLAGLILLAPPAPRPQKS